MSSRIITQPKEVIGDFVAKRIGTEPNWGNYSAIGMVDDKGLKVGVIYNNFTSRPGGYQDCCMHVASREGARWATREFLAHAFGYPFVQLGCRRVTGLVARKAKKTRKLDEHLGFNFEACLKKHQPNDDTIVYRMFAEDCRWIKVNTDKELEADEIVPIHAAWDESRTAQLTASMKQSGWTGRPVLVLNVSNRYYAMTGSHRIEAAKQAGITVPCKFIDTSKTSDALLAQYLRSCGDYDSAFLLEQELYEMGVA